MTRATINALGLAGVLLLAGVAAASERGENHNGRDNDHHNGRDDDHHNGRDDGHRSGSGSGRTTTEMKSSARLVGTGTLAAARGYAERESVTVTNKATGAQTSNASLSVSVRGLKLANGTVVTFMVGSTNIGTGTVRSGRASVRLSTKKGDTVPAVSQGTRLTVSAAGTGDTLTGTFGAARKHTESSR